MDSRIIIAIAAVVCLSAEALAQSSSESKSSDIIPYPFVQNAPNVPAPPGAPKVEETELKKQEEEKKVAEKAALEKAEKQSTIGRDEFLDWTKTIWQMNAESARRIGHPAPFPLELPHRLIQLYSFETDVVLDPFMGSGTTAVAALRSGRKFIGYEIVEEYVALARKRIAAV